MITAKQQTSRLSRLITSLDRLASTWQPSRRGFWFAWAIVALAVAILSLPTITISPPVWADEAHIVEYGRLFREPHTTWSIFWRDGRPLIPWYYVGATFLDLAERMTAPSCLGPRLFSLAGGLLASGMLAAWLLRRGTLPAAALLLSAVFLLNPPFAASYRGGRIDGWSLTCTFFACYVIASRSKPSGWFRFFASGSLLSLAFLVWPTTAFVFPLVGLELFGAARRWSPRAWTMLAICAAGAAIAFAAIELPATIQIPGLITDVPKQLAAASATPRHLTAPIFTESMRSLVWTMLILSPWNGPLIALSWKSASSRSAIALMVIPLAAMFGTLVYSNRLNYLTPYLVIFFAEAITLTVTSTNASTAARRATWVVLVAAVGTAATISLILRSVNAWAQYDSRREARIIAAAQIAAPRGASVCLGPGEFYFTGRTLDWRMFTLDPTQLMKCEKAITSPTDVGPDLQRELAASGFRPESTLLEKSSLQKHFYGAQGYGPYLVYGRPTPQPSNGPKR